MIADDDHAPLVFATRDLWLFFRIVFAPKTEKAISLGLRPALVPLRSPPPLAVVGASRRLCRWSAASLDNGELFGAVLSPPHFSLRKMGLFMLERANLQTLEMSLYSLMARILSAGPGAAGS
jgi:hypothetical protein